MSGFFLGKPLHWLMLVVICGGLWFAGWQRFHVIHFNLFAIVLLAISAFCVLVVLSGAKSGPKITREDILPDETEKRVSGD